jgi:hypothetical protein
MSVPHAREEPVVRIHAELVALCHRLGDEMAAHLPRHRRGDGLGKEDPHIRAVAGA